MTVAEDVATALIGGYGLDTIYTSVGSPDPRDFLANYNRVKVKDTVARLTAGASGGYNIVNEGQEQNVALQPLIDALMILAEAIDAL